MGKLKGNMAIYSQIPSPLNNREEADYIGISLRDKITTQPF